jgi:excisionase family DNA binding protein
MTSALLTVREAATRLGVSEAAARRWVHRGRLRAVRIGRSVRIDPQDLDAIVDRGSLDVVDREATTSSSPSPTPLPWTISEARRYLDAIDGDVAIAHAAVDAAAAQHPGAETDQ